MSDEDKPAFTVVDRRHATQPEVEEKSAGEAAGEQESQAATPAEPPVEEAPEPDDSALPNAALYISMAAMHLSTSDLVTALLPAFDAHAWQAMGLIANPVTGETHKDMPAAQLAIDCVQFLLGKAEASITEAERRDLQRRLTDLRLNYLQKLKEP